jgi:mono/diheme cytochrome c family protein
LKAKLRIKMKITIKKWPLLVAAPLLYVLASGGQGEKKTTFVSSAHADAPPTFAKDIAPILFANCATCHRPGEVAPFSLLSYDDAKKRARLIADVTEQRLMPPWHADEGKEKFRDAHVLSTEQIAALRKWAEAGAPQGNPKDTPPVPKFAEGWQRGEPDFIADPGEDYTLEAEGRDVYRCFVVKTNFPEDRYVSAIEVRPGNRKVVHHLIAYLDTSGRARQLDDKDPGPGYLSFGGPGFTPNGALGGWAPGNQSHPTPAGVGWLLPKGADIILQVHYNKSGKVETDRTRMGLHFVDGPVDKRVRWLTVVNPIFRLPAGEANHVVRAVQVMPVDGTVYAVMPHMHLLGKTADVTATLPDGTRKKIVSVPRWDFNWQQTYAFKEPVQLPAGTRIDLVMRYDNSAANPRNPSDPPRAVTWGEQTTDEMCLAFLVYTPNDEFLTQGKSVGRLPGDFGGGGEGGAPGGQQIGAFLKQMLKQFDKDGDGKLSPVEREEAWKYAQQIIGGAKEN